ncbi:hypothetical protein [Neisseria arctica]|nr:hypothetical protein [Neisseria arctica]UOO86645.1 hypothetical protein LVJ86_10745 [Neisseria arctica]
MPTATVSANVPLLFKSRLKSSDGLFKRINHIFGTSFDVKNGKLLQLIG